MFKNITKKLKNFTKNDILKSFFILFFAILFLLTVLNSFYINFIFNGYQEICKKNLQVYYLDVGQASANVVVFPNNSAMIIDTGSSSSSEKFLNEVESIFSKNHIKNIDFLVLTHSDEDHVGGSLALLKKYQVNNILRPKILAKDEYCEFNYLRCATQTYQKVVEAANKEPNCEIRFIEDESLLISRVLIKIFAPKYYSSDNTNYYCPFISLSYSDKTFLFTADTTSARENEFLQNLAESCQNISVDFLNVSHHGSKYSTTENFLSAINPKFAVVSAGSMNYPTQEVQRRLKDANVEKIYITRKDGLIAVGVGQNGEIVLKTQKIYIDLPFICVIVFCAIFVVLRLDFGDKKIFRDKKYLKNFTIISIY